MAKKEDFKTSKAAPLDNDLEMPDFEFGSPNIKDDRKPVKKVMDGVYKGAKSTLGSSEFIRNAIKGALPEGYGKAADSIGTVADEARGLYNNAAKAIKPGLADLTGATARMLPEGPSKYKDMLGKVETWSKSGSAPKGTDAAAQRNDNIQLELARLMGEAAVATKENTDTSVATSRMQEGLARLRHKDTFAMLAGINVGISRLNQYQDKLTSAFQRKSLELQMRQHFTLLDTLEESKRQGADVKTALAVIAKNTALPEFSKIEMSERFKEQMRNKFFDNISQGLFSGKSGLMGKVIGKLNSAAMNTLSGFGSAMSSAAMGLDMAKSMKDMTDMDPESGGAYGAAGNEVGVQSVNILGGKVGKYVRSKLDKTKLVGGGGSKLSGLVDSYPELLNDFRKKDTSQMGGIKGGIFDFLKMLVPDIGPERGLEKDSIGSLTQPGIFTKQTNKSINEVIPGYLARIFRELKIMRTGDAATGLTVYDYTKNSFADSKSAAASYMGLIVDKDKADATKKHTNAFLDYIETEGGKLSPGARDALGKTLIEKNLGAKISSADKFAKTSTYSNTPAEAFSEEIAAVMKKHLKLGPDGTAALDPDVQNRQNKTMGSYRQLGGRLTDGRGNIQNMINLGLYDVLRQAGVTDADMKNIDLEKITAMHLDGYKPTDSKSGGGTVRTPFAPIVGGGTSEMQHANAQTGAGHVDTSELNKSIADHSSKGAVETTNTILERIEQLIANNVSIAALAASETSRVANAISPDSKVKGDLTVKELLGGMVSGGYKTFKGAIGLGNKLGKSIFGAAGTAASAAKTILGVTAPIALKGTGLLARFGFGSLKSGLRRPDIWMPGEVTPRITSAKLDAKMYFDEATGKVIKDLKDISGTVVDNEGNVVITADELKKAVTKQGLIRQAGKDVGDAFGLFGKIVTTTARGVTGMLPPALKFGFETATKVLNVLTSAKDGPHDVYVPDPSGRPRLVLQASVMRSGGVYFDERTGGVVRKLSDISGAVTNREGEVLLTEEEFKAGIVSKYGKRIRIAGRIDGAMGLIKNITRRGGEMAADAIHLGKKVAGVGLRLAGSTLKGAIRGLTGGRIFGKQFVNDGQPGTADNAQIGLLMEIRDLLSNRLPEPKRRKGDWRDMATGAKKTTEEAKPGEKKAPGKGILQAGKDVLEKGKDLWDMGKSALSLLGIGGGAATLAGGAAAAETVAVGGAAAAAGGGGLLAMMGAAGTAIAGGVATIVGSPVILGALAVAALAGAGYMGYKYLTKNSATKLEWVRLAQYGLTEKEKEKVSKIFELEDYLKEFVSFGPEGARLMSKGFKTSKVFEIFGIAPTKTADVNAWTAWFDKRFKPVFLTHVTALKAVAPNSKGLDTINSLKKEDKLKYLKSVQYPEGPYSVSLSPFPDVPKLTAGSDQVATAFDEAMKELSSGSGDKTKQGAALIGAAAAATLSDKDKDGTSKSDELNKQNAEANKSSFLDKALNAASTAFMMTTPIGMALSLFTSPGTLIKAITGDVKALQAARYRTYGLKSMDGEKVNALYSLEQTIAKDITFEGSGRAAWKGSASELVRKIGKEFGISNNDQTAANTWVAWFTKRFLPVFLSYMEMLKQYTGKTDLATAEMGLKPADSLALANRIIATPDVWGVTVSPWPGYELSTDVKDTNPNIAALRATAKSASLGEVTAPDANKSESQGVMGNIRGTARSAVDTVKNFFGFSKPDIPDAEGDDLDAKSAGGGGSSTLQGAGKVNLAGGSRADGRGASQYLKLASGVTLNGLNPSMHKNLMGMIEEYGNKTGKATTINSGFRSRADQEAAYKKDPSKAAKPGTSLHEFGLAVDINSATLNEMDKLGLMRKYGFTRPVANEPWHTEPIGIQFDLSGAKANPNGISELIENSIGKGGGGIGTATGVSGHGRDAALSRDIYGQRVSPMADAPNAIPPTSDRGIPVDGAGNIQPGSPAIGATKASMDPSPNGQADSPGPKGLGSAPGRGAPNATTNVSTRGGPMLKDAGTPGDAPGAGGSKDQLPDPKGGSPWQSMKDIIMNAAKMTGVSPSIMAGVAAIESGFQSAVKAGKSSATGLFQFVSSTWDSMVQKYGRKYGITADTSPTDPKANALMGGEYLKENMAALSGVKKNPNATDAYIAHFLGAGGAKKFFSANPNAIGAQVLPEAAASNPDIFYGSGGKPKTISEIYNSLQAKMDSKFKAFGIDLPNPVTGLDDKTGGKTEAASGYAGTVDATKADGGMQKTSFTPASSAIAPSVPTPPVAITSKTPPRAPVSSDPATGFSSFFAPTDTSERAPIAQNTKSDTMSAIGGMGKTLETSLAVQQQQLDTLIAIKTILEGNAAGANSQSSQPTATPVAASATPTPPKAVSSLPISLARTRQTA